MNTIELIAGKPHSQKIRLIGLKNTWASLTDFEIRAQLRSGKTTESNLISNLHVFMTPDYDGDDILVNWFMSGSETRSLYDSSWGINKVGYFNLVVSDIGTEDEHAYVVPLIQVTATDITTKAVGDT